ncbi:DDE superendonuclease family protein [Orientia chuto str. Dubai]|uniref:DDE superendonuclease family protein n=1 Tax=Orientia chuto str. Dubai TaxID=1359168 RepID=A0A0F3MKK3_9RICK|nr:DDE superendonuclease family protein [Orientia chuto str. Dubai]
MHNLGFVYKKSKLIPAKLNQAKQEELIEQYRELKSKLKPAEALYFMDSVHLQYQDRNRYGWILKGKNKTLPSNSGWKKLHLIGAIEINDLTVFKQNKPQINTDYVIEFLANLEKNNPDKTKIYLICDNASCHK